MMLIYLLGMQNKKITPWYRRFWLSFSQLLRWLTPGIGVKRWIGVILLGTTFIGLGVAVVAIQVYRDAPNTWWLPIFSALALVEVDRILRALIFGSIGVGLIVLGIAGLNRSLLRPFIRKGRPVVDAVTEFRKRERGPKVVTIGGGTGLSSLLRGLKQHTNNLTAIVTVADDGGSSGELRRDLGILPPGDIRHCLTALADDEEMMTQIFQYRFGSGAGLDGHSFGNLFISALADITGSFEEAVVESGRVLAVRGQVLPATLHDVKLVADIKIPDKAQDVQVRGESEIPKAAGRVNRVWLEPNNPLAYPPAIQAILQADVIVIGPGSLYTSILPTLLVPDLAEAVRASRAQKFLVVNVASQPGETDGYDCFEHVKVIEKHIGAGLFDVVVCNMKYNGKLPEGINWVKMDERVQDSYPVYAADLVDVDNPLRHDSKKLGKVILDLFLERTGPLALREGEVL